MIYLDTSVALSYLLAEDRRPPVTLWEETLVSSRLLEYETWTSLHGRGLAESHGEAARWVLGRIAMLELVPSVLARALDAFPGPGRLRTLDALHLASCAYLVEHAQGVALATYDRRMADVARALEIPLFVLEGSWTTWTRGHWKFAASGAGLRMPRLRLPSSAPDTWRAAIAPTPEVSDALSSRNGLWQRGMGMIEHPDPSRSAPGETGPGSSPAERITKRAGETQ